MIIPDPGVDPDDLLDRSGAAPAARTLVDILRATVAAHGAELAIDDGRAPLTYDELAAAVARLSAELAAAGVRPGDRVGVRIPSGTASLYVAILAVLESGAAYVPVDVDDPDARARLVFGEAGVDVILAADGEIVRRHRHAHEPARARTQPRDAPDPGRATSPDHRPHHDDDAWVIFTSGSTGTPKGVAVTHRSAAAFVDAERRLFVQAAPLGPGDRVLAGLSVAFDASCEEMWLAWAHGACLVPAPRALVRTGADLGPWLVAQRITVISTVPTLAGLWRADDLTGVRLLIFGGEACPPELVTRLAVGDREVWNTYGPTEATVVACAARLTGSGPVRIGLPLDGWALAVVDGDGRQVDVGGTGELVIGGVGLARYLDAERDAEKFAPAPALGWPRAYRSGDLVRLETAGLVFVGRADDQVKLGGRRIELGEIEAALLTVPHVAAAAAAVQVTAAGHQVLVGYVVPDPTTDVDLGAARAHLQVRLPAPLVPLLAVVATIPTRGSGKVDRDALPWPVGPIGAGAQDAPHLTGTAGWLAEQWTRTLGVGVRDADDDFFDSGGGSLTAARLVSVLRARFPHVTVADVYENPRLGALAQTLDEFAAPLPATARPVTPTPRRAQAVQTVLALPLHALVGLRASTWLAVALNALAATGRVPWAEPVSWWWVLAGWALLISPVGRMGLTVAVARALLRGVRPGRYPRGGAVHLRLWFTESFAAAAGAENLAGAPWVSYYARALGAHLGRDVDLHALPPVTGLLTLGAGCSIEPEVDLSGHWLDGDMLVVGRLRVDAGATVGARSILMPGTRVGQDAEVRAGSAVLDSVPPGEQWAGSPAVFVRAARHAWPERRAPRAPGWVAVYGATAAMLAALPVLACACGLAVVARGLLDTPTMGAGALAALRWIPCGTVTTLIVLAGLTLVAVRALGAGLREGHHAVRSRIGWQVWATERLMDDARTWLFPLYSSLATPVWLRALGAQVGRGVEASTALLLPRMTTIGDGAFLADDTLIGSYELGHGWLRIQRAKVGKRAFLGNSGMTGPGRAVPKRGLVAVLSSTPRKAKAGTSWLGSPPVELRRTRERSAEARTFEPSARLRVARASVELARIVPVVATATLGVGVLLALAAIRARGGGAVAALASGPVVIVAAVLACALSTAAKWVLVGRTRTGQQPLWSSFVWRNELADTFVEMLAAPWFARGALGTPALALWLRSLGARIGRGVWCETYWLPEADLVTLGDGTSVNRGCVLQTHLFHDRIMSMDAVTLEDGATLGPQGVILPAATIGRGTTVGAASLVLRGDAIPAGTRWTGNPVAPWTDQQASR